MAGDAGNSSVDEYSSAEECVVSPLMSQDAYQLLDNANSMYNLHNMVPSSVLGDSIFDSPPGVSYQPDPFILSDYEESDINPATEYHVYEPQRQDHECQTSELETTENNEDCNNEDNDQLHKNLKGFYNFDASFHGNDTPNPAKSTPWTYSPILNKLFVSFNLPCPVKFSFGKEPPFGSFIRATPYFKQPENAHFPVLRCLNHQSPKEPSNQGFNFPEHIIRSDFVGASYEKNAAGRPSVVVPYYRDEHSLSHQKCKYFNYYFTCFSSCVGGMNRRPIIVVFSLEHGNMVLGQKVVEVRICACPGRDRMKGERVYARKMEAQNITISHDTRNATEHSRESPPFTDAQELPPPEKRSRPAENEEDRVLVSVQFWVHGKERAQIYQSCLDSIKNDVINKSVGNNVATSPNVGNQRSSETLVVKQEE